MVGAGAKTGRLRGWGQLLHRSQRGALKAPLEDNVTARWASGPAGEKGRSHHSKGQKSATIEEYQALKEQVRRMEEQDPASGNAAR